MQETTKIQLGLQALAAWICGIISGIVVLLFLCLLGGCGTISGLASDIEVGARAVKEHATPYSERTLQPRVVYTVEEAQQ